MNPIDINDLFVKVKEAYEQTSETFYISTKHLRGLHLAILPHRDEYIFSSYNFGDDNDVVKISSNWNDKKVFNTFGCTLCPIQNKDNAVLVSDTQNQLYLDPDNPSAKVQTSWTSSNGQKYIVTATVPQYYYNHLLFMSEDHIPTYAVFTNPILFSNVFEYLTAVYPSDQRVTANFNGAFGSDIYHFHLHLTNQTFTVVEYLWQQLQEQVNNDLSNYYTPIDLEIIHGALLASTDITALFENVRKVALKYYILSPERNSIALTANLATRYLTRDDGQQVLVYMVFFQYTRRGSTVQMIDGCGYSLFPAAYTLTAGCFNIGPQNYMQFAQELIHAFRNVYIPFDINDLHSTIIDNTMVDNFKSGIITTAADIDAMPIEKIYTIVDQYFDDFRYRDIPLPDELASQLQAAFSNILDTSVDCYKYECEWDYNAKFQYLLGMFIITLLPQNINNFLQNPEMANVRIKAVMKYLYKYNGRSGDMIRSDYLYFRGTYLASLLKRTFDNLLLISTANIDINTWLNYVFNRIGEPSASGINTVSKLHGAPTVDFVMKMMPFAKYKKQNDDTYALVYAPEKKSEYQHEFQTSVIVNHIRDYIPNFILCYGGFSCQSSISYDQSGNVVDMTLCNPTIEPIFESSYILLENVKNSRTVGRHIKLPDLTYEDEANDHADMLLQIFTALMYGQTLEDFTHYDLHLDNIMVYDFVKNPNYLKLFKIWDEYEGSKIPKINNIYFVYHILSINDSTKPIIVPAKYLYLIIDYGSTYVKGLSSYHTFPVRVQKIGMTSDRPKFVADVYTCSMSLMFNIIIYKPYLIFDEQSGDWLDNKLTQIFIKVLVSYAALFNDVNKIIQELPKISQLTSDYRYRLFKDYMDAEIKPQFAVTHFQYLHKDFTDDMVANDFNDATKVVWWIYTQLYDDSDLRRKLQDPDTYVFNWGGPYLPEGMLQGVEPNDAINQLLTTRKEQQKQQIAKVRSFTQVL